MFESILKSIFSFMLVVIYCQKLLLPSVATLQEKKAEYFKLASTVANFSNGLIGQEQNNLKIETSKINKGFEMIKEFVPPFNSMRSNIERKFDELKENTQGTWNITKSPTFVSDDNLTRWHFKLNFTGSFKEAIKAVAMLEGVGQLVNVNRMKINYKSGDYVDLETDVDLIFLNLKDGEKL